MQQNGDISEAEEVLSRGRDAARLSREVLQRVANSAPIDDRNTVLSHIDDTDRLLEALERVLGVAREFHRRNVAYRRYCQSCLQIAREAFELASEPAEEPATRETARSPVPSTYERLLSDQDFDFAALDANSSSSFSPKEPPSDTTAVAASGDEEDQSEPEEECQPETPTGLSDADKSSAPSTNQAPSSPSASMSLRPTDKDEIFEEALCAEFPGRVDVWDYARLNFYEDFTPHVDSYEDISIQELRTISVFLAEQRARYREQ